MEVPERVLRRHACGIRVIVRQWATGWNKVSNWEDDVMNRISVLIRIVAVICFLNLGACASDNDPIDRENVDETQVIVLDCSNGWAKCTSAANQICGSRGFDEVDRFHDTYMSAAGTLEDQGDGRHVARDTFSQKDENQTMAIRCR